MSVKRALDTATIAMTTDRIAGEQRDGPVCVVDDDPGVRDLVVALLEALGFEVLAYGSGAELLADQRHRHAGCLILDQHMPGMDGFGVLAALEQEQSRVATILITGRLDASTSVRSTPYGLLAVLEKPFSTARLVELVRASLDRPR